MPAEKRQVNKTASTQSASSGAGFKDSVSDGYRERSLQAEAGRWFLTSNEASTKSLTESSPSTPSTCSTRSPVVDTRLPRDEPRDLERLYSGRASVRRKLQNRLNQRAFRKRRATKKLDQVLVFNLEPPNPDHGQLTVAVPHHITHSENQLTSPHSAVATSQSYLPQTTGPQHLDLGLDSSDSTTSWSESLVADAWHPCLDPGLMVVGESPSLFFASSTSGGPLPLQLPPSPTPQTVTHQAYPEICPNAMMRDHPIKNYDPCMTLAVHNPSSQDETPEMCGCFDWRLPEDGDPWDVSGILVAGWVWLL